MKQKVVIKLCPECHKCRSKALKIAVSICGVESAALKGDDKNQIEVTGDGMDPVALTTLLRKRVGYAELVTVGPAGGGGDKKKEPEKPKGSEVKVQPIQYCPYNYSCVPQYVVTYDRCHDPQYVITYDQCRDPCSIL